MMQYENMSLLEMLEDFIEGQLEFEPEHYSVSAKEMNAIYDKIALNSTLESQEIEKLKFSLETYAELYEFPKEIAVEKMQSFLDTIHE